MTPVSNPFSLFTDTRSQIAEGAQIFIGLSGQDPETAPKAVFWDAALTIAAQQPLRTVAGYIVNGGSPATPYVSGPYSIRVRQANGAVVYYNPSVVDGIADVTAKLGELSDDLASPDGADKIGFDASRSVADRLSLTVYVTDTRFAGGAKGNGVADDRAAIQAALDFAGQAGGGTVILPPSSGRYRITAGLKMPSYVTLQGIAAARYPFNAGNASTLVADFTTPLQWVIDTKTTHDNQPFAYNELTTTRLSGGGLPNGATYNCTVRDLVITSTATAPGSLPYGGIRMIGCPGSIIDNVAVQNVGCGVLINCCFGGRYSVHTLTAYYGVVAWDDVNGNSFEVYAARQENYTGVVPDAYQTAAYNGLFNNYVSVHGLAKNDHFNRSTGLIFGSAKTTSGTNVVEYVGERWQTGMFSLYAYALHFTKFYVESASNVMLTAVAGARSNILFDTFHAYLSGTGEYFDTGFVQNMSATINGITFAGVWGRVSNDTASFMTIRGRSSDEFGPPAPQFNIINEKLGSWKAPVFQGSWTSSSGDFPVLYRREASRLFFVGEAANGAVNQTIFILPAGNRPSQRMPFDKFYVTASGEVVARVNGPIALTGASFEVTA